MNNATAKEVLEFAAKAQGLPYEWRTEYIEVHTLSKKTPDKVPYQKDLYVLGELWNPLESDGDALRLAVKLKLCVAITDHGVNVSEVGWRSWREVQHPDDPYAATRRAIVRSAAEIGKAIEQKSVSAVPDDNYEKNQAEAFYSDSFGKESK